MECPVCKKSGLPEEIRNCPECNSDLSSLQTLSQVEKTSKSRFILFLIFLILFFVVLAAWLITGLQKNDAELVATTEIKTEQSESGDETDNLKKEIDLLKSENVSLSNQIAELSKKKEKIYTVQEGETLFFIARKIYGNGYKYEDIAKTNNISDPNVLLVGQKLKILY